MVSELLPWTQTQAWTQTTNMGDDVECVNGSRLDACLGKLKKQSKNGNTFLKRMEMDPSRVGVEKCR